MPSTVRVALRNFQRAFSPDGADMSLKKLQATIKKMDAMEKRGGGESRACDDDYVIMVDMDHFCQLMIEVLLDRMKGVEKRIRERFIEGDENGDGVLSFHEFTNIVINLDPTLHERRILKMFREALTASTGNNNEHIGPGAFVDVCKTYGLVHLVRYSIHVVSARNVVCLFILVNSVLFCAAGGRKKGQKLNFEGTFPPSRQ